ncbi:MAG: hypothetical protein HIU92_13580 [Proteobacteria bacterium]|nr:hypothetical protein [Pseudomonadota bacterium]
MPSKRTSSYLAIALAAGLGCVFAPGAEAAQAVKAVDFLQSLGVNTHMNYTDGTYADYDSVIADLNYLGIRRVRDAMPDPYGGIPYMNYMTALDAAATAGIRFDFITSPRLPLSTSLDQIAAVERLHPGAVIAVEGPNETNNNPVSYHGRHGEAAALAYQRDLYRAIHGSRGLHHIAVYYYTGLDTATKLTGLADFANCHPYSSAGQQPARRIAAEFAKQFTMAPPYPKVITEAGYFDVPSAPNGVDNTTQAKNTLNLYMDAFAQGAAITYVYQLVSAYTDQGSDTQSGMFNIDHSPKPVATAVHNLTTILADDGKGPVDPASLDYTVAAMPVTGHSLLLEKSSGVFDIILWSEPTDWNDQTHQPIGVAQTPVTVAMSGISGNIAVYDPLTGSKPIENARHVSELTVGLSDHPIIIEVRPTRERLLTAETGTPGDGNLN